MRQRFITFAVFGIILVILGEWNLRTRKIAPIVSLDQLWLEFCIGNAGDKIADPAISVVRINDEYEPLNIGTEESDDDGNLSRLDFATILGFVGKMDPKSVAFLPIPTFDETHILNQTDIVPLKDAAMQLPRFSVATNVTEETTDAAQAKPLTYQAIKVEGDPKDILSFSRTLRFPDPQLTSNADPVFKAIESQRDLVDNEVIRIPLVARHGEKVVPSIVLSSIAKHNGIGNDEITLDLTTRQAKIRLGDSRIVPIEPDGTFIIPPHAGLSRNMTSLKRNEAGEMEKVHHFTTLTVDELAYTGEKDDEVAKRILASFQGKFKSLSENIVVIGFDRNNDRRYTTATGEVLSETMLLARAMATIQSGRFINQWPATGRWLAILLIAAIAAFLFTLPKRKFIPFCFVAALIFFALNVIIFRSTLSWAPPFSAFALFGLIFLIGLLLSGNKKQQE
tara:strand:+ start:173 stop:1525 length:1353 start_codon:yes stop_codon:yes gene_type:complete